MAKRKRKKYWVDREIQGALAARVIMHWMVYAGIAVVLTVTLQCMSNPFGSFSDHFSQLRANQSLFGLVMAILLPIFIYDTVQISNRFAGPILRLRRVMRDIAAGKPPERIEFRKGDFWFGMAEDFNRLVDQGFFDKASQPVSNEQLEAASTDKEASENDADEAPMEEAMTIG